MKYLDRILIGKKNDCKILISDSGENYETLTIQIEVSKYNKSHLIVKTFEDRVELKFNDVSRLRKLYNVCCDTDVILKDIFNRTVEKDEGVYKYHLTNYNLYVRKGLTKFIILQNRACIDMVRYAIIDYYEQRKHLFGIKECPPKVL